MASEVSVAPSGSEHSGAQKCPFQDPGLSSMDHDPRLRDILSRFNREKIPERAVHARGAGAYGEFEVRSSSISCPFSPSQST